MDRFDFITSRASLAVMVEKFGFAEVVEGLGQMAMEASGGKASALSNLGQALLAAGDKFVVEKFDEKSK